MTNSTRNREREARSRRVARRLGTAAAIALIAVSCDGQFRLSGLMLGGKDRRLVDPPVQQGADMPSRAAEAGEPASGQPPVPAGTKPPTERSASDETAAGRDREGPPLDVTGSGRFVAEKLPPVREAPPDQGGGITLNFVDADVRDVIKTVLGSTLGHNFAIDPKVRGAITLQTTKPIPRNAVLPTLESALSLNGVALVRSGAIYRVVPANTAARNTPRPRISAGLAGSSGEAYGVEILPLEFAAAAEMAKILEPLVPSDALVRTDINRNLLIVGGTRQERQTIADIVAIFDVDWLSGMSFALVPLQFAQPDQAITDLERVFGSARGGPLEGLVRFFPVERRQSILVVSAKPEMIDRARGWIKRLDVGGDDEKRLYVYSVENARATDLAAILGQVFSGAAPSLPSGSVAPGQRQALLQSPSSSGTTTRTTTSTVSAQAFGPPISATQATPQPAASPPASGPAAAPTAGAPAVPGSAARATPIEGRLPEELTARIIADDVNNALVIMAKPAVWHMIEEALRKLDVVPLQVMIEATIVEVTLNDTLRYGVQSFFTRGSSTFAFSTGASSTIASTFPGFSYVYDQGDIRAILDALDSITDIRVVSSPQVLVLDNRTAELQVGDQVPVTTQQSISNTDPDAPTVNSVNFRDTGVVLRVTPRVNASGVVNLEIEQEESSAVATTTSGIDSPTIQQRKLRSSVVVNSGETVALGGLIRDTQTNSVSGIPLLSSIPVLGALFSSTSETGARTELLAFITPRVIRNQEEARAITRDLRKTLRNAAALKAPPEQNSQP